MTAASIDKMLPKKCFLLSLPGELRNRIYDHCVEPGDVTSLSQSIFGNLRYTCRAIYNEYTPMYLTKTVILLRPSDVQQYLSVFYPRKAVPSHSISEKTATLDNELAPQINGNICIDFRIDGEIDLTPLVRLRSRLPEMEISIAHSTYDETVLDCAAVFVHRLTDRLCKINFEHTLERILLRLKLQPEIIVKLHEGVLFKQLSNGNHDKLYANYWDVWKVSSWLYSQGVPSVSHVKFVLEGSEGVLRDGSNVYARRLRQDPRRHAIDHRRTKGRPKVFKRTPSMEALFDSWLPSAPSDGAGVLTDIQQLSVGRYRSGELKLLAELERLSLRVPRVFGEVNW